MIPPYTELRCLSNFSFLRGASKPEELVAYAQFLGHSAIAIADECSMANIVRAHVAAKEAGMRLRLKAVHGRWQREGDVRNLIAGRLEDLTPFGEL